MQLGEPVFADVAARALTPTERAVVRRLARRTGLVALVAQADGVQVDGACRCGCASVRLTTSGDRAAAADLVTLCSHDGGHLAVEASATAGRSTVHVVLHVVDGRLHELECFAGDGVAIPLPPSRRLRGVTLQP